MAFKGGWLAFGTSDLFHENYLLKFAVIARYLRILGGIFNALTVLAALFDAKVY